LEGFQDVFDFRGADVGRREVDTGKRHWFKEVQRCKSEQSSYAKVRDKWNLKGKPETG
jgi:hypothetical protein